MNRTILLLGTMFGSVALAQAPPRPKAPVDAVTIVDASQLQSILKQAPASKSGKAGEVSMQLFPSGASCSFIRLTDPDPPHVHPVSEIYVMQSGSGTLETGGTMLGPFTSGGVHHLGDTPAAATADAVGPDHGGSALQGGHSQVVRAGDVILVPAGVNHHWTKVDQPLVYLDIKFPKPDARP